MIETIPQQHSDGTYPAIESLLDDLASADARVRADARDELHRFGAHATPYLIALLTHPLSDLRWEAAKTLSTMGDPVAMEALIDALDDDRQGVRWLAANGLIAIGQASVPPLLRTVMVHPDDFCLRQGAHHIFSALRGHVANGLLSPVLTALEGPAPTLETPLAAYHALEVLQGAMHS